LAWQLTKGGELFGAVFFNQRTQPAQILEAIDSRIVTVCPGETERVVANLLDVAELEIDAGLELNPAGVALAAGTRAKPP
jgi:hypothetical protein